MQRVLIVEDEKDIAFIMKTALKGAGYEVSEAFDGIEALEIINKDAPDVILLDVMMPKMNGYDVCRKLKLDENFKNTPVLMLTAKFQPNDIEFGKKMGADAYLTKPLELEALLHKINALLRAKRKKGRSI